MKQTVLLMSSYNLWANRQFVEYFSQQDAELINKPIPGSFPSIQKTLIHIWDAQHIWYRRLHGESPQDFKSNSWLGSLEEMYAGLLSSSQEFVNLVETITEPDLQEQIDYVTISSGPQSCRRYEILLHVFNHSMYHRGQCVTMARILNMKKIPSTDLIRYLRIQR